MFVRAAKADRSVHAPRAGRNSPRNWREAQRWWNEVTRDRQGQARFSKGT